MFPVIEITGRMHNHIIWYLIMKSREFAVDHAESALDLNLGKVAPQGKAFFKALTIGKAPIQVSYRDKQGS
jgi:hypothetical protein